VSAESSVDVVVPLWNSQRWVAGCAAALAAQTLAPRSVVWVDDGSTDGTVERLRSVAPDARIERLDRHQGFAAAANRGIEVTDAPWVALLNADTRAAPNWLQALVGRAETAPPSVGSAASRMLQMDDPQLIDDAGDLFTRYGSAVKRGHGEPAAAWSEDGPVTSACAGAALYRRAMLREVGAFDESFDSYLEDVDLGLRAQLAGWGCLYVPRAVVVHAGGGSALPRSRYVRLMTANRAATVLKNVPAALLARRAPSWLWGQWYFLLAYRRPLSSLAGYWDLARRLRSVLHHRRRVQGGRRLPLAACDRMLARQLGEPPLRRLLWRRLRTA
jgi:GT2 family glycosyltransferase